MNIVDVVITFIFITALMRGVEIGIIRQACSTAGLFVGLFLGVFLQGKIIHLAETPATKALLTIVVIFSVVGLFLWIGGIAGDSIRKHIERAKRLKVIERADQALGAIVAGGTLLVAVWLGASIFNTVPLQDLQRQIRNSAIIAQLNKSLPPAPDIVTTLGHLIDPNGFPEVFSGLEPKIDIDAPLPSIGELDSAVQHVRLSVVKIEGPGCGGISQGSGFIADDGVVITNAHVVAGVSQVYVLDGNGRHPATVTWFDPDLDIAVVRTDGLAGEPLVMATHLADAGTPAAVIGYPGGGDFSARPAVILESFQAIGRNIYNQSNTERQVYSMKADIEPGNSGGPIIDKDGRVVGVVFAESTTYDAIGYALTTASIATAINHAKANMQSVGTGSCTQ